LEGYRRDIYTNPDPSSIIEDSNGNHIRTVNPVTFEQKIKYCLENRSVPFLHKCNRNLGLEPEIAITSNIRSELKKYDRTAAAVTMETLASKIPGFSYTSRWIGDQTARVVCGPLHKFISFLIPEISESKEDSQPTD